MCVALPAKNWRNLAMSAIFSLFFYKDILILTNIFSLLNTVVFKAQWLYLIKMHKILQTIDPYTNVDEPYTICLMVVLSL